MLNAVYKILKKRKEPRHVWYLNPWGLEGGLFGSVTIIFALGIAYKANWLTELPYVIFISSIILAWGYQHSKTMQRLNIVLAERELITRLMESQHKLIPLFETRVGMDEEIISQQLKKIKSLKVKIEALEVKL